MTFSDYKFDVMWKNDVISSVSITNNRKTVEIKTFDDCVGKQPFCNGNHTLQRVYDFLEYRCFEKARPDCDEILEYYGLTEYNPWEIVKKTHGRLWEDYLWIRFEGENLTWDDVRNGKE